MQKLAFDQVRATDAPFEAAINAAFTELAAAESAASIAKGQLEIAQQRVNELRQAIQHMARLLPSDRRISIFGLLNNLRDINEPVTRGGVVYDNVVTLLRRSPKEKWNPSEIQEELQNRGIKADTKAIANILGYLAKNKMLRRVARGQYVLQDGSGIISAELDGMEDGTSRASEHD